MSKRTPAQIIGHDALTQLVFEGYVVVRAEAADHIAQLEAECERLRGVMRCIDDMITNCPDAPSNPDSLIQMVRHVASEALKEAS